MGKMLAVLVAIAAVIPAAAHALDINCEAPLVVDGDARQGPGTSVGVRVAIDENGLGWQVFHDLRDGRVISRVDQYEVNDLRNPTVYMKNGLRRDTAWIGTLRTNRNLIMEGRLFDQDGKLLYGEELIDFKINPKGDLRMTSVAFCGPDPSGARWRTIAGLNSPSSIASSPPASRWSQPPQASLAPPPPPQPVAAPPSGGGDIVPIVVDHGRARVAVNFANYPLPQTMVIDTGASIMSVTNELAAALIDRGMAYRMDQQTSICLADGACQARDQIMVRKLSIGGRTVIDVPAIMVQDNVEMLLPFGVLNQAGKFTIDSAKGLLELTRFDGRVGA